MTSSTLAITLLRTHTYTHTHVHTHSRTHTQQARQGKPRQARSFFPACLGLPWNPEARLQRVQRRLQQQCSGWMDGWNKRSFFVRAQKTGQRGEARRGEQRPAVKGRLFSPLAGWLPAFPLVPAHSLTHSLYTLYSMYTDYFCQEGTNFFEETTQPPPPSLPPTAGFLIAANFCTCLS